MAAVISDIRELTASITEWCDQVHPDRTGEQMIKKLEEELKELLERPLDAWEMADLLIILFDLCNHYGFDAAKLIHHKMNINRKRTWSIKDGVLKHDKSQ